MIFQIRPLSPKLHENFEDSELIFDIIYTSLNVDFSGTDSLLWAELKMKEEGSKWKEASFLYKKVWV